MQTWIDLNKSKSEKNRCTVQLICHYPITLQHEFKKAIVDGFHRWHRGVFSRSLFTQKEKKK